MFPSKDGTPIAYTNFYNRVYRKTTSKLGLDDRGGLHALRRTFATIMETKGAAHGWDRGSSGSWGTR